MEQYNFDKATIARALIDLRDTVIQKSRIQFSNRVFAVTNGKDNSPYVYVLKKWLNKFGEIEKDIDESIYDIADEYPIVRRMCNIRGIGRILALKVVAMIDIEKADTISSLWRYAGYGVIDGKREYPKTGEKLHYNMRLKSTCYLIGKSFLRNNPQYRKIYDEAREYYASNRDWTKAHIHYAAMRKMIKLWLAHLWLEWRELEGLPVSEPWIAGDNCHYRILLPGDFGWNESTYKKKLFVKHIN